ncbi:MAG: hypothetical protein ACYTGC_02680, partial [Planctomycetota bacterium]
DDQVVAVGVDDRASHQLAGRQRLGAVHVGPSAGETAGRATSGVSDAGRLYVGRCYHQAPQVDSLTYVHSTETLAAGELVRCTVVDADGYDLIVRPTEQLERKVALPVV